MPEQRRHAMRARDLNGHLGPHSRHGELAPPVVEDGGETRGEGGTVGLREAVAEVQR
jgi:hypothetical protein